MAPAFLSRLRQHPNHMLNPAHLDPAATAPA